MILRKHPIATFFVLTIAITWGCIAVVAGPGGLPMSPESLSSAGPLVYAAMLAGPSIAGLLLTGWLDGREGYRVLLSRMRTWRVAPRWYALALLPAPILATTVLLALSLYSSAYVPSPLTSEDGLALLLTGLAAGLVVGFFEEIGWTGFAVSRLLPRHSYLLVGVGVGLLWGAWHFPPFWEADSFTGTLPFAILVARLFLWLPAYRVLMVWVYERTQSLLVVILMHASLVASTLALPPMDLTGRSLLVWLIAWALVLWAAVLVTVLVTRSRRGERD